VRQTTTRDDGFLPLSYAQMEEVRKEACGVWSEPSSASAARVARVRARARASTHVLRVGLLRQQHLDLKELRGGAAARPAGVDRRGEGGEVHQGVAARPRAGSPHN
jgi:hypothetical protein